MFFGLPVWEVEKRKYFPGILRSHKLECVISTGSAINSS